MEGRVQAGWINYVGLDKILHNVKKAVILAPRRSGKSEAIRLVMESLLARDGSLKLFFVGPTIEQTEAFHAKNPHLFPTSDDRGRQVALFLDEGLYHQSERLWELIRERPYTYIYIFSTDTGQTDPVELKKDGFRVIGAPLGVSTPSLPLYTREGSKVEIKFL
jgi:hypothetical protein